MIYSSFTDKSAITFVKVSTSLPPGVEGEACCHLRVAVSKILWLINKPLGATNILMKWWGESTEGTLFRPVDGKRLLFNSEYTANVGRFPITCGLKQFAAYLHDMGVLILHVLNNDVYLGSVFISNLHHLIEGKPINGFFPVVTSSDEKIADVHVSLVLEDLIDQSEDVSIKSITGPTMNTVPLTGILKESKSSRNPVITSLNNSKTSAGEKKVHFPVSGSSAMTSKNRTCLRVHQKLRRSPDKSKIRKGFPPVKANLSIMKACAGCKPDMPERQDETHDHSDTARSDTTSILQYLMEEEKSNSLNVEETAVNLILGQNLSADEMAIAKHLHTMDNIESTDEDTEGSIVSDPVHDEDLLQQLFYTESSKESEKPVSHDVLKETKSEAVSIHGNKNQKITNGSTLSDQIKDKLGSNKIEVLSKVKFARVYIDSLKTEKESQFFQEKEDKKYLSSPLYMVEYGFPIISPGKDKGFGSISSTETIRISSKKISNDGVYFGHRSVFPVTFSFATLVRWWKSSIPFQVYVKHPDESMSTLIGTSKLSLRSVLESNSLCVTQQLCLQCSVKSGSEYLSTIDGNNLILKAKIELASDVRGFYSLLANMKTRNTSLAWQSGSSIPDDSLTTSEVRSPTSNRKPLEKIDIGKKDRYILDTKNNIPLKTTVQQYKPSFSYVQDNLPVQAYLNVSHGTGFLPPGITSSGAHSKDSRSADRSNRNWTTRNLYLECRMFGKEDNCQSLICWSTLNPVFHYSQVIPLFLNQSFLERNWNNYMVIEVWDKIPTIGKDQLVGICKIPLHQFYLAFKDRAMIAVLLQAKYPVIGVDCYLPVNNVFTSQSVGQLHVILAIGTSQQIFNLQKSREKIGMSTNEISNSDLSMQDPLNVPNRETDDMIIRKAQYSQTSFVSNTTTFTQTTPQKKNKETQFEVPRKDADLNDRLQVLQQHIFEIEIQNIQGLLLDKKMLLEESECFIQYYFLIESKLGNIVLHSTQSSSTPYGSNPVFNDKYIHTFHLDEKTSITEKLQEVCGPLLPFFIWRRKYQPHLSEVVIARANLPVSRICSLVTMWNQKQPNKISLSLPLLNSNSSDSKVDNLGLLNLTLYYSCSLIQGEYGPLHLNEIENPNEGRKEDDKMLQTDDEGTEISDLTTTFLAQIMIEQVIINSSAITGTSETEYKQNIYITIPAGAAKTSMKSPKLKYSNKSELNWCAEVRLPTEMLINSRKPLLLKVWSSSEISEDKTEHLLGFCVIDLLPLPLGLERICGWYNVIDFNGKCQGQLKISIKPIEDISHFKKKLLSVENEPCSMNKRFITVGEYPVFPSHISQHWEQSIQLKQKDFPHDFDENTPKSQEDLREVVKENQRLSNKSPSKVISEERNSNNIDSLVFNRNIEDSSTIDMRQNLKKHLKDLEDLNVKLKEKLMYSKRLITDVSHKINSPDVAAMGDINHEISRDVYASGEPQPESPHRNEVLLSTSKHLCHRIPEFKYNSSIDIDASKQDNFLPSVLKSHSSRHITNAGDSFIAAACISSVDRFPGTVHSKETFNKEYQSNQQISNIYDGNQYYHQINKSRYSEPTYYYREPHGLSREESSNKLYSPKNTVKHNEKYSDLIHVTDPTNRCVESEHIIPNLLKQSENIITSNQNTSECHLTGNYIVSVVSNVTKLTESSAEKNFIQSFSLSKKHSDPINNSQDKSVSPQPFIKGIMKSSSKDDSILICQVPIAEKNQEINNTTVAFTSGWTSSSSESENDINKAKQNSSGNSSASDSGLKNARLIQSSDISTVSVDKCSSSSGKHEDIECFLETTNEVQRITNGIKSVNNIGVNNFIETSESVMPSKSVTNKSVKKVQFSLDNKAISLKNENADSSELDNVNVLQKPIVKKKDEVLQRVNDKTVKFPFESFKTSSPVVENVDFSSQSKDISPIYPSSDNILLSDSSNKSNQSNGNINESKKTQSETRTEAENQYVSSSSFDNSQQTKTVKVGSGRLAAAIFSKPN